MNKRRRFKQKRRRLIQRLLYKFHQQPFGQGLSVRQTLIRKLREMGKWAADY